MRGSPVVDVVVVDDEVVLLEMIIEMLEAGGFRAVSCRHGPDVVACIRAQQPRLLVLDAAMPPPDGLAVFSQLRAAAETATLPVLFLTATPNLVTTEMTDLQAQHAAVLAKPFQMDELIEAVGKLVHR